MENLYSEPRDAGNAFRDEYLAQVRRLIAQRRAQSVDVRQENFTADYSSVTAYEQSLLPLREKFRRMLGFPLVDCPSLPQRPQAREVFVAEDDLGTIQRLHIEAMPGYEIYGLLFTPHGGNGRLVISQHGGGGTPELASHFFGPSNYNDMTRRILRRGYTVFAPQLLLWNEEFGNEAAGGTTRHSLDRQLKQLGGSITALELFGLQRSLDYLLSRPGIRADGVGMCGLSYGGFYTLFAAANDTRIKAALSSCFVNDRFVYDWTDWTWQNAGNLFLDGEIAALVRPRALYIEVGKTDTLFDADLARPVLEEVRSGYERLGIAERCEARVFEGGHELDWAEDGLDFLQTHLS